MKENIVEKVDINTTWLNSWNSLTTSGNRNKAEFPSNSFGHWESSTAAGTCHHRPIITVWSINHSSRIQNYFPQICWVCQTTITLELFGKKKGAVNNLVLLDLMLDWFDKAYKITKGNMQILWTKVILASNSYSDCTIQYTWDFWVTLRVPLEHKYPFWSVTTQVWPYFPSLWSKRG